MNVGPLGPFSSADESGHDGACPQFYPDRIFGRGRLRYIVNNEKK